MICFFGEEGSSSHYCDPLLFASTCIGIKNSIINFLFYLVLASKTLEILSTSVKVENFVRAQALNYRIYKKHYHEMGGEHKVFWYHIEVRWFSKGQVLKRLTEQKKEVSFF